MTVHHETIVLEQMLPVPPGRAFSAYVDTAEREVWSAPSETAAVKIDRADVRTGGTEATRCGSKDDLRYRTEVRYHLVEQDALISFSETLMDGETVVTAALVTFEFGRTADGHTRLRLTDQVTSFVGPEAIDGHRQGFSASLRNFAAFFTNGKD
jgi:uncharacterized protein YndB with AHSA1/START domain